MKNTLYILLLFLFLLSCGKSRTKQCPDLVKAESLMLSAADSALSILSAMPVPTNKAQYALWCLLLTQAQDKNHIRHTSDSLIQIALHYFEKQPDLHRQATALYYAGRVQDDLYNKVEAADYYVQAFDRAAQVKEYHLMALISNCLGRLYLDMDLKDKALEQQFLSYTSDSLAKDTIGVIYSLREIGSCYLHLNKLDSALLFYQKALTLSGQMKDTLANALLNNIAVVYREQNKIEQAITYFHKAMEKTKKQNDLYANYSALGWAYLIQQQLDSAAYYLVQSTQSDNYYTKAGSYTRLYDLEIKRNNYKLATTYNELYLQYRDSVDNVKLKAKVAEVKSKYDYEKQQNAIQSLELKKSRQAKNYAYLVSGLLCAIMLIYILYQKRLNRKEKELQKNKDELQLYKNQLEDNETKIKENQIIIAANRKEIEAAQKKNEILATQNEELLTTNIAEIEKKQRENEALIARSNSEIEKKQQEKEELIKQKQELIARSNSEILEKQQEKEELIKQNQQFMARSNSEILEKQRINEVLMQKNNDLRSEIYKKEAQLKENKISENQIIHVKNYLIQKERHHVERIAIQDPILKPLLLCANEKKAYSQKNWKEAIMVIDDLYDGLITKLRHSSFSLTENDIRACSLLLINFRNVEIAYVTESDVRATHKRIERLAKKLKVPKGETMITFLLGDLRMEMSTHVDN